MTQDRPTDPTTARLQAAAAAQDWPLLVRLCRQTLRKQGRHLLAHRLLGIALYESGKIEAALETHRKAVALWPQDTELLLAYATMLIEQARGSVALPLMEKVVQLLPDHSTCWTKLAQCYHQTGSIQNGFDASQRALKTAKNDIEKTNALLMLAAQRRELGEIHEAIQDCKEGIKLTPQAAVLYTNCLLYMLADPQESSAAEMMHVARAFSEIFERPLQPQWPRFEAKDRSPWRRLRIGFVSPDFRNHSVMYFIEGLMAQLDRRMFEVVAFYLYPAEDHITARIKRHADRFIRLAGRTPDQQAQAIRDADIDIAIDLAGHTGENGLLALMRKPAPVQISWLGYPATTGLDAMDYKFTDEITDPEGAESQYTEQLYRLPTLFCCYRPLVRAPLMRYQPMYLVQQTPALSNGYITFGSCNNLGKLTDEVLRLWGRILQSVPNAHLLIEGKDLAIATTAAKFRARCDSLGIPGDRLDLIGQYSKNQYLTYHRIDIALDPFPLVGGTTTCDLLWMGVPLVSMVGESFKSRMGTGILSYLGRTEWLAHDADEYVRIAQGLASDVEQLNQLRLSLRHEVEQSPVMREDLHTHHFGKGLRMMWLQWLARTQYPDDEAAQQHAMQEWVEQVPPEWSQPPTPGVGLEPGKRVLLQEAHALLEALLEKAKAKAKTQAGQPPSDAITDRPWLALTNLAEKVLCAVPNDPVALACLAEVEYAHGHTEFAVTYLHYASEAMAHMAER